MMISAYLRHVREVSALSEDVSLRHLRFRREVATFGQALHGRFGTFGLLLGGFSAGFLFDRLRPHWPVVYSGGSLGMSLLKLVPLIELTGRTFGRGDAGPD
jgi:hypothetical protein